jgi:flagellum-specific peptidoglycan hydrolase FlgJ
MDMNALMAPSGAKTPTRDGELLSLLRQQLTQGRAGLSLEQRLARLTPEQRQQLLMFARFAQSMAAAEVAMKGYSSQSYAAIVKGLYRGNTEMQKLIVDVLEDVAPIEVRDEPKPSSVSPISLYDRPEFKLPVTETAAIVAEPSVKSEHQQASLFSREALPDGPDAFVKRIAPKAKAVAAELGIDPRIVVAQAALETGWGKSVKGNN